MKIPRFLIGAGASGSGKTLITCGILQALKDRGLKVASFKCGPDYIDPMFHSKVIGTKSRNLDTFFAVPEVLNYLLTENAKEADVAVMEGVMGYYDGVGGISTKASAYDLASQTQTPSVLIVNAKGMSVSVLAYIKGFLSYTENSQIRGVILNQLSPMMYPRMKKMIEEALPVKVYGYVPKVEDCILESRHLGLVMPQEVDGFRQKLKRLAAIIEDTLDLDGLLAMAGEAPEVETCDLQRLHPDFGWSLARSGEETVRIGVAQDEAFCFFYEDNFRLLKQMGAQLVPFSPLHDKHLPQNLDGMLLYGGYPELFAEELEHNASMREEIQDALEHQMPCMAECGGFMYLHQQMEDMDGKPWDMAGVIQGKAYRTKKLNRFGYITLQADRGEVFGRRVGEIPAHEFHYFDSTACGDHFTARKPLSIRSWDCLWGTKTLLAGFPHLYYYGNPSVPKAFLECAAAYKKRKKDEEI